MILETAAVHPTESIRWRCTALLCNQSSVCVCVCVWERERGGRMGEMSLERGGNWVAAHCSRRTPLGCSARWLLILYYCITRSEQLLTANSTASGNFCRRCFFCIQRFGTRSSLSLSHNSRLLHETLENHTSLLFKPQWLILMYIYSR
jgi:hypothetical protein